MQKGKIRYSSSRAVYYFLKIDLNACEMRFQNNNRNAN